jgi:hypothetical protein
MEGLQFTTQLLKAILTLLSGEQDLGTFLFTRFDIQTHQ